MSVYVRPGPATIDPGRCPGGLVVYVYGVPTGRLIYTTTVDAGADVELNAAFDADKTLALTTPHEDLCLVFFDGDSGQRWRGYRCPFCGAKSHNPIDRHERYCGHCHQFAVS